VRRLQERADLARAAHAHAAASAAREAAEAREREAAARAARVSEREREAQLAVIRANYLGTEKTKRKVQKTNEKFRCEG